MHSSINALDDAAAAEIAAQSLPSSMAVPVDWHSEILEAEYETSPKQANNSIGMAETFVDSQEEYIPLQTQKTQAYQNNRQIDSSASILRTQSHTSIDRYLQQSQPPIIIRKQLPNNLLTYQQNISLRYLKPPTPPPPGPLIIREVRPPPPRPRSPIQIRQRPPPPVTPTPLVLRERPPPAPSASPSKIVEKLLPPPPAPPRRIVVERYGAFPPKPRDVIIERWLPYKKNTQRRVLLERAPPISMPSQEPNLLIVHESPSSRIHREYINEGVIRVDPDYYIQRYNNELRSSYDQSNYNDLVSEATHAVPPPVPITDHYRFDDDYYSYPDRYRRSSYSTFDYDRRRSYTPSFRSSSYYYRDRDYIDLPYDYSRYRERLIDTTPRWRDYYRTPSYSYYPSSYDTIRVRSENEFQDVISDLTHGRYHSRHYHY